MEWVYYIRPMRLDDADDKLLTHVVLLMAESLRMQ